MDVDRRTLISVVGTGTVLAGGLGLVYLFEEGHIDIGEGDPVNEVVEGGTETFSFEAEEDDPIEVETRVRRSGSGQGTVELFDPDERLVVERDVSLSHDRTVRHHAEQDGTYEVRVDAGDAVLRVRVTTGRWEDA